MARKSTTTRTAARRDSTKDAAAALAAVMREVSCLREKIDLIGLQSQLAQLAARVARLEADRD